MGVYGLAPSAYVLHARTTEDELLRAEPFPDLVITPEALWA